MSHPLLTSRLPAAHDPAATWLLVLDNLPPPAEATPAATLSALTDSILLTAFLSTSDSPDTPVRLYAANLHSSTLQPFLATSSKSTADYYTLLYNALTKIDFADATQHVQLTLNLDPLTNLVDLQWKTTPVGSAFSFVLGAVTLQPVTDSLRVSFAQQMYLARLADQQAQYLDVIAKHQAEVAAVRQARQVALDELMVFAWAAREREDAMLLKFQALLNEKKRKVKKVQAENRKLKLVAAGSSTGFADQTPMDVDQPGMVQTTRALSPTVKTTTAIGSLPPPPPRHYQQPSRPVVAASSRRRSRSPPSPSGNPPNSSATRATTTTNQQPNPRVRFLQESCHLAGSSSPCFPCNKRALVQLEHSAAVCKIHFRSAQT
ncbi:hypothetical protein BCR44DRAFT_1132224 [Catenaria anguillulae PL171]|uniref:Uncharacterized protein n=1 Tax=Catenaria anguillulae PL171 TaxID=765915 RepID=A0A1Y2HKK9_9FUNG|nr:hypothetical protein BCR44DRAFT_1132224 [Catenaria anguillulae PL171]